MPLGIIEGLLVFFWLSLAILLPGAALAFCLKVRAEHLSGLVFVIAALGTALQPILGVLLDATFGISTVTLVLTYSGTSIFLLVLGTLRRGYTLASFHTFLGRALDVAKAPRKWLPPLGGVLAVGAIAAVNWSSGIGVHSVDMGWHVYWAKTILATGHLPNYARIEPFDQASKFTFGAQLVLASFEATTGLSLIDFFWVPVVFYAALELVGIFSFVESVTRSRWLAFASAAIIAGAYLTGGYIQRGNFPDILGYFVIVFVFWLLALIKSFDWRVFALGLSLIAVIEYHQLAAVVAALSIIVWIVLMTVLRFHPTLQLIKSVFEGRRYIAFWGVTFLAIAFMAMRSTYLNGGGASVLATSNWARYIPPLSESVMFIGFPLLLLGALGVLAMLLRRKQPDLLILGWIGSLTFLANSPRFGMNFEPARFMWRLPEPLAISAAIGIAYFIRLWESHSNRRDREESQRSEENRPGDEGRPGLRPQYLLMAVGLVGMILVAVGTAQMSPRYAVEESHWSEDSVLAAWLKANADPTKYVVVSADTHNTASWIMAMSMLPHFLYKVDFGVVVSPPPYLQVYEDLKTLYDDPSSATAVVIVHSYNLGYVVVDSPNEGSFLQSPYFRLAYNATESAIFVPIG